MFVCYLDDSDNRLSSVSTLAGYMAPVEDWKQFEVGAHEVFQRYGVSLLHAKEFHDTKGDFSGWSRLKKESFVNDLYAHAEESIPLGISRSMRKSAYKRRQKETRLNQSTSAHGVLFASIMHGSVWGSSLTEDVQAQGISFVVEAGHKNNSELEQYFHKVKLHEMFQGIAKSISFVGKGDSAAIQLADFYAFHSRRFAAVSDKFDGKLALPITRVYSRMQLQIPHWDYVARDPYGEKIDDWRVSTYKDTNKSWRGL